MRFMLADLLVVASQLDSDNEDAEAKKKIKMVAYFVLNLQNNSRTKYNSKE